VKLKPGHAGAQSALFSLYLASRDLGAARQQFKAMQHALPKHPLTLLHEGQLAFADGNLSLARDRFQTLLRASPENLVVLQSAAAVELQLRAPTQAEALLTKALQIAPDSAPTWRGPSCRWARWRAPWPRWSPCWPRAATMWTPCSWRHRRA
jgi:predicted Zn-dependent protease